MIACAIACRAPSDRSDRLEPSTTTSDRSNNARNTLRHPKCHSRSPESVRDDPGQSGYVRGERCTLPVWLQALASI
eukprot:4179331-Prymnesium_polylepis.1